MTHALSALLGSVWAGTSALELAAAVLAVVYLLLAIGERIECWLAAFFSSCLYVWVLFAARLYMESALNAFYAAMALYGFWQWHHGADENGLAVSRWALRRHLGGLVCIIALSVLSWSVLRRFTAAAWPLTDSLVTWASVFATFLVARKVYENWYWWLVIDAVSLCVYLNRGLYLTVLLFALYLCLILFGMRQWRRSLSAHAQ